MSLAIPTSVNRFSKASEEKQAKEVILKEVGTLDKIDVMQNDVLVATYIRPEKTSGGIFLPDAAKEEDLYQGKVGLVIKLGPAAFNDPDRFGDKVPKVGDWIVYRVGDAWDLQVKKVHCRLIRDTNVRLIVNDPEEIF